MSDLGNVDRETIQNMNAQIIEEFRANGGEVGGMFAGVPMILVHHVGAKSGKKRLSPLACLSVGGRLFVFASKGGSPEHPAWFLNLMANPDVTVEFGPDEFPVRAKLPEETERDEIYAKQASLQPQFDEYQRKTTRKIPVVELVRR